MSRIGKKPIDIPAGVSVKVNDGVVEIKGAKATLTQLLHQDISIKIEDNQLLVERPSDSKEHRALHGLFRALLNNMVVGVTEGFSKKLEINGIGYKAALQGKKLVLNLGYSHPIEVIQPEGITFELSKPTEIIIKGADKQLVGETAAKIRSHRTPDAYKGKGIKYDYEVLHLKEGKTGAKAK